MDFRDKQCASFNGNSLDIEGIPSNVRWVPKYVGECDSCSMFHEHVRQPIRFLAAYPTDECKLFCRVTNSNHYYPLSEKVIDGTACTQDTFNKCVNGVCRPAACDNQMFSKSQLDKCGVCNGNNDSCIDVTDVLHQSQLVQLKRRPTRSPFYHDVCRIPAGSSNIDIVQMGHLDDLNYIGNFRCSCFSTPSLIVCPHVLSLLQPFSTRTAPTFSTATTSSCNTRRRSFTAASRSPTPAPIPPRSASTPATRES